MVVYPTTPEKKNFLRKKRETILNKLSLTNRGDNSNRSIGEMKTMNLPEGSTDILNPYKSGFQENRLLKTSLLKSDIRLSTAAGV